LILAGQDNLLDSLQYRSSLPLASRIVARIHLEGINLEQMQRYLAHHLRIAGVKTQLFSEPAITAIQQGSAGLLRKANHLARGALIAANEKCQQVSADHVRLAATEFGLIKNAGTASHAPAFCPFDTGQNNQKTVVSLL
jgi:type II secretory pathway predicted ATPase ExeA